MPPTTQIRIRRDTAANFTSANPTLALGEIAYETDTFRFKVGTGSTAWTSLGYAAQNPTTLTVAGNMTVNGLHVGTGTAAAPTSDTVLGLNAGAALTGTSTNNVMVGDRAGQQITSNGNVFVGSAAGRTGSLPNQSIAIGLEAMEYPLNSATLAHNIALGYRAGWALSGPYNIAIGDQSLASGVQRNIAIGSSALQRTRGSDQTAVGVSALALSTLGTQNVALGRSALGAATTAIGTFATSPSAPGSGYTANQTEVTVTLVKKSGADTFTGTVQAALTTNASGAVTAVAATPVSAGSTFTGSNVIFEPSGFGGGSGCEISIASLDSATSNTAIGHQAGVAITTGDNNTVVGANAGDAVTTGAGNTLVGLNAGGSLTSGSLNVAVGQGALITGTTAGSNIAVGWDSLVSQTGSGSVGIGAYALRECSGNQNVAVGNEAGRLRGASPSTDLNTAATTSIFIGHRSRAAGDSQTNQIVIGSEAVGNGSNTTTIGNSSTTGTFIPAGTLNIQSTTASSSTTTGALVVSGGVGVAKSIRTGEDSFFNTVRVGIGNGADNTLCGVNAGAYFDSNCNYNAAFGTSTLLFTDDGSYNVACGSYAMFLNTSGDFNTALGYAALQNNAGGSGNMGIGSQALYNNSSGSNNSGIGGTSLYGNTTGSWNVGIGTDAGRFHANGSTELTDAEGSVYIGAECRGKDNSDSNSVVIAGRTATARGVSDGANTTVLGNAETTGTRIAGTTTSALRVDGDTIRLVTRKAPASNAAGNAGDICIGESSGTHYLYFCIASGNWGRVAFTTGY